MPGRSRISLCCVDSAVKQRIYIFLTQIPKLHTNAEWHMRIPSPPIYKAMEKNCTFFQWTIYLLCVQTTFSSAIFNISLMKGLNTPALQIWYDRLCSRLIPTTQVGPCWNKTFVCRKLKISTSHLNINYRDIWKCFTYRTTILKCGFYSCYQPAMPL